MSTDLKIEIFAHIIFHDIWLGMMVIRDIPHIREIYGDECILENSFFEACNNCYLEALYCRSDFLGKTYQKKVLVRELKFESLFEVYEYIVSLCDRDDLFGHLTVFEKMLATSEVVANFCCDFYRVNENFIDILRYGHLFWAMYFDKFTKEFYENGGWKKLKCEAESYECILDFKEIFYDCADVDLQPIKQALVNYYRFKNTIDEKERNYKYSVHVSKPWIKFQIEHFENYIYIPLSYQTSAKAYEVELLLKDLKLLLDPSPYIYDDNTILTEKHQNFFTKTSHSKISCDKEKMKVKPDVNLRIQHLVSEVGNSVIDKTLGGFSLDSKGEAKIGCPTSAIEELTNGNTEANIKLKEDEYKEMVLLNQSNKNSTKNSKIEHNRSAVDMKMHSKTGIKSSPTIPNVDSDGGIESKFFINKNEDSAIEFLSEDNVAGQTEITNIDQVVFLPNVEKTECQRNSIPEIRAESDVLDFPNESINNFTEMCLNSTNGQIATAEKESTSPVNRIVESDSNGQSLELNIKDFGSVNENANSAARIEKKVHQEQKDPDIQNFLKMILFVGDLNGAKVVRSAIETNREGPENNMNKLKKNSDAERTSKKLSQSKKKSKKKK